MMLRNKYFAMLLLVTDFICYVSFFGKRSEGYRRAHFIATLMLKCVVQD